MFRFVVERHIVCSLMACAFEPKLAVHILKRCVFAYWLGAYRVARTNTQKTGLFGTSCYVKIESDTSNRQQTVQTPAIRKILSYGLYEYVNHIYINSENGKMFKKNKILLPSESISPCVLALFFVPLHDRMSRRILPPRCPSPHLGSITSRFQTHLLMKSKCAYYAQWRFEHLCG